MKGTKGISKEQATYLCAVSLLMLYNLNEEKHIFISSGNCNFFEFTELTPI